MVIAHWTPDPDSTSRVLEWSSRTSFNSITDGLSNTFLVGEKHVPLGAFANNWVPPYPYFTSSPPDNPGDGAIYNGMFPWVVSRIAGPLNPLAQQPIESPAANFGSFHPGVCQFAFADGSVRALPVLTSPEVLGLLASRNDGQNIPDADLP
jgi:prepilin-type processing-associated H-X9-DG protein